MARKSWREKLMDSHDFPCIEVLDKDMLGRKQGDKMLIAPPLAYDEIMKAIPFGEVISTVQIREKLARKFNADFTCPLTAGIFINIVAHAAEEMSAASEKGTTPWWRTVKKGGELNEKFPGGVEEQARRLQAEGQHIVKKGTRWYVLLTTA